MTVTAAVLIGASDENIESAPSSTDADQRAYCSWLAHRATDLQPAQERNAKIITAVAFARGLGDTGAAIGIAAALAESTLFNYANDGSSSLVGSLEGRQLNRAERAVARRSLDYPHDRVGDNLDSIGLFQQRPMTGWGPPEMLIDPLQSTGLFYDELVRVTGWQSIPPWDAAQSVQNSPSSNGEIFRMSYAEAVRIVAAVSAGAPGGSRGGPPGGPPGAAWPATGIAEGRCG